ncbi:unnamed protein product [Rhizophagus irregularis]|nr:unnamed protein product [Rhizophagus irregularis]
MIYLPIRNKFCEKKNHFFTRKEHVVFFVTSKTVVLSLDSRCKRGSARQVVADYIKELEKKVQELQEQVNGMDRAYRDDQRELLRVHNELKKAERKITRLEGEERDEEGQERRQRKDRDEGKGRNKFFVNIDVLGKLVLRMKDKI